MDTKKHLKCGLLFVCLFVDALDLVVEVQICRQLDQAELLTSRPLVIFCIQLQSVASACGTLFFFFILTSRSSLLALQCQRGSIQSELVFFLKAKPVVRSSLGPRDTEQIDGGFYGLALFRDGSRHLLALDKEGDLGPLSFSSNFWGGVPQ